MTSYLRDVLSLDVVFVASLEDPAEGRFEVFAAAGVTSDTSGAFRLDESSWKELLDVECLVRERVATDEKLANLPFLEAPYRSFVAHVLRDRAGLPIGWLAGCSREDLGKSASAIEGVVRLFALRCAFELAHERSTRSPFLAFQGHAPKDPATRLLARVARDLDVCFTCLADGPANGKVRVLAAFDRGEPANVEPFEARGTPWEDLFEQRAILHVEDDSNARFETHGLANERGLRSFLGLPLHDTSGNGIGFLVAMDERPLPLSRLQVPSLPWLEARATALLLERRLADIEPSLRESTHLQQIARVTRGVAHDFNNYLAAILGNANVLSNLCLPGEPGEESLGQIRQATEQARDLTRHLLEFMAGRSPAPGPIELEPLLTSLLAVLRISLDARSKVATECEPNLPPLFGTGLAIRQILMNLILNANAAMQGAGTLSLRVHRVELDQGLRESAFLDATDPGDSHALLEVRDEGPGMSAERLEAALTGSLGPRGIGLRVVLDAVRALRGALWMESSPDRGTRVRVALPLAVPGSMRTASRSSAGRSILLVEDEPAVRDVTRRMLNHLGCRVEPFSSGLAALEALPSLTPPPDLALVDVSMEPWDGFETRRRLLECMPHLPVFLMSGYPDQVQGSEGGETREFLTKPFELADLRRLLARIET